MFKIRAVAINVNYRYVEGELNYLFDNSDMVALLHERPYAPLVAVTAPKHEKLTTVVAMPDPTDPGSDADIASYAGIPWEEALAGQSAERDFEPRQGLQQFREDFGGQDAAAVAAERQLDLEILRRCRQRGTGDSSRRDRGQGDGQRHAVGPVVDLALEGEAVARALESVN